MHVFAYLLTLPLALAGPILQATNDAEIIPGKFIVVMNKDVSRLLFSSTLSSITSLLGTSPSAVYDMGSFKGFAVSASDALIQTIANLEAIQFVEPDTLIHASALVTQQNPPYGLARISSHKPHTSTYTYDSSAGEGIIAYGIDTGIFCGHNDFDGRCEYGANFSDDEVGEGDGNGHGTHTAGTMASSTYGVAKKAQLVAVKVLGAAGSGSNSAVISGIQWAANDMVSRNKVNRAVANLSLGGPRIGEASNQAVAAAVKKGLFMSIAAGNSMAPTVLFTPASEPSACTVAASDRDDKFASFSNFGALVDVIAPGVDVLSTWINGPDDTNTISGTSMAAPHIGGLGAYLLALEGPRTPVALCNRIRKLSTKGAVTGLGALLTSNRLAFNGVAA